MLVQNNAYSLVLPTLDTVKYRTDEEYKAMVEGHFQ